MIKNALVFAVSAACLVSGAAFAQSSHDRNDRYERDGRVESSYYAERHERNERDMRSNDFDRQSRRDYYRNDGYRNERRVDHRYGYGRGDGYNYRAQMRRGERLSQNSGQYYVVNDWHRHNRLYAPQRGYQWVQVGTDYALVAIATGIIANVLLNN